MRQLTVIDVVTPQEMLGRLHRHRQAQGVVEVGVAPSFSRHFIDEIGDEHVDRVLEPA